MDKRQIGRIPPLLDLELNTDCNLRCKKCFQGIAPPKRETMDLGLIEKVITEFMNSLGEGMFKEVSLVTTKKGVSPDEPHTFELRLTVE